VTKTGGDATLREALRSTHIINRQPLPRYRSRSEPSASGAQRSSATLRRYCQLRDAWLPSKDRERLRTVGCDAHELDDASAEALALWNRITPDEHGWSERDFARLRR